MEETKTKGGKKRELKVKTLLFVERTLDGGLVRKLCDMLMIMEQALGFRIKIVELARALGVCSLYQSISKLGCGREDCVTCGQEAEELAPFNRSKLI